MLRKIIIDSLDLTGVIAIAYGVVAMRKPPELAYWEWMGSLVGMGIIALTASYFLKRWFSKRDDEKFRQKHADLI